MSREPAARLSRQGRKDQILDSAGALILERGLSQCTLEAVAIKAGISKALIYRHFSAVEDLLKALLERDYRASGEDLSAKDAENFQQRIRLGLIRAFNYCGENGAVVHTLLSDPGVAQLLGAGALPDAQAVHRVFAGHAAATYDLPRDIAALTSYLMLKATTGAGEPLKRMEISPDKAAEVWATFCEAGWAAVAERYSETA